MKRVWGIIAVALLALTGCSSTTTAAPAATKSAPASSLSATERSQEQKDALRAYVKAERSTLPKLREILPGTYSKVTVEGTFETKKNHRSLPDGIHAVVWFDYTFVPGYDLPAAYQQVEASEAEVHRLCKTSIFPLMREYGVDPPMGVVFTYHAAQETLTPLTTLSCSAPF